MKKALSLLFPLLAAACLNAQSMWQYLPNAPKELGRIDDVFFLNPQMGWCATSYGRIYQTTDGGLNWKAIYSSNSYFRCIEFLNEKVGYAGTLDQKFLRTTDGGKSWVNLAPGITPTPLAVCGISIVDSVYAYAVGEWDSPGFLLKTIDGGNSWIRKDMAIHAQALVDVLFVSRDTGYVAGQSHKGATLLYTTDGGNTWKEKFNTQVPGQFVWKIQRVTPQVWVCSIQTFGGGKFARTTDGGATWQILSAPIPDMQGIGFSTPEVGWVGGYVSGMYETTDGGLSWVFRDFGGDFNRFYFLSPTLAYASGASVYKYAPPISSTPQPPASAQSDDGFFLHLSPNPVQNRLQVDIHLPVHDIVVLSLLSGSGQRIRSVYHKRLSPGDHRAEFDCGDLPAGTYLLGVQRNHGLYTKQFLKM
ncbi:MAG TPA: YCF48-related protein [Saprospiraceae bacterium]|nr:YCF48-related protein [Saprospiraceae bacterium]